MYIRNFKSIKELEMKIKDLTILIGPNNSGKTSFLHALALLKQSVPHLSFSGPLVNLGNFKDVVYRHDLRRAIQISFLLSLRRTESEILEQLRESELLSNTNLNTVDCTVDLGPGPSLKRSLLLDGRRNIIFDLSSDRKIRKTIKSLENVQFSFESFLAVPSSGPARPIEEFRPLQQLILGEFSSFLHYISSRRGITDRFEPVDRRYSHLPDDVGLFGENTIPVLAFIRDDEQYKEVMEKISLWSEQFGLESVIAHIREGPTYSLKVKNKQTHVDCNVLDIGFGVNQLLPVIVQCFYAPKTSLIMIEQPEAHLHPQYQADVTDLLIDVVKYGNRVIVETHSEHILLRLQRRIAEGKIKSTQVNVCYFRQTPEGTDETDMKIDKDGYFVEPIPEGFFEEGFDEAIAHLRASHPKRDKNERN